MSSRPNPMREPEIHYVELTSGETQAFDRVILTETGWLSCWLRGNDKRNVKFPPHMVEKTYADYPSAKPSTATAAERLGGQK